MTTWTCAFCGKPTDVIVSGECPQCGDYWGPEDHWEPEWSWGDEDEAAPYEEYEDDVFTNRDRALRPRKGKFWCSGCDAQLTHPGRKCVNCGIPQLPKRSKK